MNPDEQQIAVQGVFELLNLTHALAGGGGSLLTAGVLGLIYKLTKKNLREGLIEEATLIDPKTGLLPIFKKEVIGKLDDFNKILEKEIHEVKELVEKSEDRLKTDHISKNTEWLRDLDSKIDVAKENISGLQEGLNGVRERIKEGF